MIDGQIQSLKNGGAVERGLADQMRGEVMPNLRGQTRERFSIALPPPGLCFADPADSRIRVQSNDYDFNGLTRRALRDPGRRCERQLERYRLDFRDPGIDGDAVAIHHRLPSDSRRKILAR